VKPQETLKKDKSMSTGFNTRDLSWKEIVQIRLIRLVEDARKRGVILPAYDGPVTICPNCGKRISDKWTHISDPSGVGCRGFLTKEVHEFHMEKV
jgi:hypothetical protein